MQVSILDLEPRLFPAQDNSSGGSGNSQTAENNGSSQNNSNEQDGGMNTQGSLAPPPFFPSPSSGGPLFPSASSGGNYPVRPVPTTIPNLFPPLGAPTIPTTQYYSQYGYSSLPQLPSLFGHGNAPSLLPPYMNVSQTYPYYQQQQQYNPFTSSPSSSAGNSNSPYPPISTQQQFIAPPLQYSPRPFSIDSITSSDSSPRSSTSHNSMAINNMITPNHPPQMISSDHSQNNRRTSGEGAKGKQRNPHTENGTPPIANPTPRKIGRPRKDSLASPPVATQQKPSPPVDLVLLGRTRNSGRRQQKPSRYEEEEEEEAQEEEDDKKSDQSGSRTRKKNRQTRGLYSDDYSDEEFEALLAAQEEEEAKSNTDGSKKKRVITPPARFDEDTFVSPYKSGIQSGSPKSSITSPKQEVNPTTPTNNTNNNNSTPPTGTTKMNHEETAGCKKVLEKMRNHRLAPPFSEPVDAEALGIPDYPLIIKNPMDLGTISQKLAKGMYKSIAQFAEDVRLIWKNCQLYNMPDSRIYINSKSLEELFEKRLDKMINMVNRSKEKAMKRQLRYDEMQSPNFQNSPNANMLAKRKRDEDIQGDDDPANTATVAKTLSPYELVRLQNIEKNKQMMKELGLDLALSPFKNLLSPFGNTGGGSPGALNSPSSPSTPVRKYKKKELIVGERRVSKRHKGENAPLYNAVQENSIEKVMEILKDETTDVNQQNTVNEETALQLSSSLGLYEIVKLLLDHPKTDIHLKQIAGLNALDLARRNRYKLIEDLLVAKGAVYTKELTPVKPFQIRLYPTMDFQADPEAARCSCCHICRTSLNRFPRDFMPCKACPYITCKNCLERKLGLKYDELEPQKGTWICDVCLGRCVCHRCVTRGPPKWFGHKNPDFTNKETQEQAREDYKKKVTIQHRRMFGLTDTEILDANEENNNNNNSSAENFDDSDASENDEEDDSENGNEKSNQNSDQQKEIKSEDDTNQGQHYKGSNTKTNHFSEEESDEEEDDESNSDDATDSNSPQSNDQPRRILPNGGKICTCCHVCRKSMTNSKQPYKNCTKCPYIVCKSCFGKRVKPTWQQVEPIKNWTCPVCNRNCACQRCLAKKPRGRRTDRE